MPIKIEGRDKPVRRGVRYWAVGNKYFRSLEDLVSHVGNIVGHTVQKGMDSHFRIGSPTEKLYPRRTNALFNAIRSEWRRAFREFGKSGFGSGRSWEGRVAFKTSKLMHLKSEPNGDSYARYMIHELAPFGTLIKQRGAFLHTDEYRMKKIRGNPNPVESAIVIPMRTMTQLIGIDSTMEIKEALESRFGTAGDVGLTIEIKKRIPRKRKIKTKLMEMRDKLRSVNRRFRRHKYKKRKSTSPYLRKRYKRYKPRGKKPLPYRGV